MKQITQRAFGTFSPGYKEDEGTAGGQNLFGAVGELRKKNTKEKGKEQKLINEQISHQRTQLGLEKFRGQGQN